MSVIDTLRDKLGGSLTAFVALAALLLIIVVAFIAYRVARRDLQSVALLQAPRNLASPTPLTVSGGKVPTTLNGQEYAYSFWVYLTDFQVTADPKLVFMRGGPPDGGSATGASPIVYMDAGANRMRVAVRTNLTPPDAGEELSGLTSADQAVLSALVDYVPLQRWVHYVAQVQDSLLTVYQDGDVYTVENAQERGSATVRPVITGQSGDVLVGAPSGTSQVRGYITKLAFYNYALSQRDVRALYRKGPGETGLFGLPTNYRLRSPIYRLDSEGADGEDKDS